MTKNSKFNKKILFKTTSALTCLVGAVLLFNQTGANAITSTGTMSVTTTVTNVCSLTATALVFSAFPNTASTYNSTSGGEITTSCSGLFSHILNVTSAQDAASGVYYMITGVTGADDAKIGFKLYTLANAGGTQLSGTVAFKTATGTGSEATVATLFGQITTGNEGKISGSYTKSIALNAVYN